MIIAIDSLDATAQVLGIDTTSYQKSVLVCIPTAIEKKAKEILEEIDTSQIEKFIKKLTVK